MGGYLTYYLAIAALSYVAQYPPLLIGIAVVFLLHRFLPDPWVWLRTSGHVGRLKNQIAQNASNVTARRDLAMIHLERRRPKRAVTLLEEANNKSGQSAELLYLLGLALHRSGRSEEALPKLVRAVELDPKVRFGEPYLAAGDALFRLARFEEALDSYERFTEMNTSSIQGLVKLARAQAKLKDTQGAEATLANARATFRLLPSYKKRAEFWYRVWLEWVDFMT